MPRVSSFTDPHGCIRGVGDSDSVLDRIDELRQEHVDRRINVIAHVGNVAAEIVPVKQ